MPIENNEVEYFTGQEGFAREIGFNPYENTVMQSYEIDGRIFTSRSVIGRIGADLNIASFAEVAKKPKQKPIAKLLDEVSEANKDVFDRLNKVQEEINAIEKIKLVELANKHDDYIFIAIGKNYALKKASEKTKQQYINALSQQLVSIVNNVTQGQDHTLEDFTRKMIRHTSRFVMFDKELENIYTKVFADVYEYYNLINEKKKEKKSLMGREDKKPTVCEDYLYGNISSPSPSSFRISIDSSN